MNEELEGKVKVCPFCYSHEIDEVALIGGPMAHLDNDNGSYKCHKCGRTAVPMEFNSWEEYLAFIWDRDTDTLDHFRTVQMLPVFWDGNDEAYVTDICWNEGLELGERWAPYNDYLHVSSDIVHKSTPFVIDVKGTLSGDAQVDELQRLLRRKADVSLDIGIRDEQDAYDSFTMGAWEVIACTWAMPSIDIFEKMIEMTDRCIPCLCHGNDVVWSKKRDNPIKLEETVRALKDIGYGTVAVMDLWGLGKGSFRGGDLVLRAKELGVDVIAGGGISMAQLTTIRDLGAQGAILDPFSPDIQKGLEEKGMGKGPARNEKRQYG